MRIKNMTEKTSVTLEEVPMTTGSHLTLRSYQEFIAVKKQETCLI